MVSRELSQVVQQLRRMVRPRAACALTDAQLLEHFASRRDETAFEILLARHGPMVLALCRRLLRNAHDAEDAFQATFLILVRKAGSLRERDLLGNWLYGVAYRIAVRVRAGNARRQAVERLDVDITAGAVAPEPAAPELAWLLQEELSRLPAKYRSPVVLCYLEGQTNEEAARRLRWPVGTVKGRLTRARALLRRRLIRRGVTLSSAALTAALSSNAVTALPPPLIVSTVKAGLVFTAGPAAALGGLSPSVLGLANGSLRALALARLKVVAALVLVTALFAPSAGMLAFRGPAPQPAATEARPLQDAAPLSRQARMLPPAGTTVDLKARFVDNQPFYQECKTEATQVMKVAQMEVTQHQAQTFWIRWTPQGKQDGNQVVKQQIVGLKMDLEIGGNKVAYDSTARNQPANPLNQFLNGVQGAEFTMHLKDDPKSSKYLTVVKFEGRDALVKRLGPANVPMEPLLKTMLSEEALRQQAVSLSGGLCGRVVRQGETWTGVGDQNLGPIGRYRTSYHYTYDGPDGALDRIKVTMTLHYTPPPAAAQQGMPFTILKADLKNRDGSGVILFDRVRGRIACATLDTKLEGTLRLDIGGQDTTVAVHQTQRTTLSTTDNDPLR